MASDTFKIDITGDNEHALELVCTILMIQHYNIVSGYQITPNQILFYDFVPDNAPSSIVSFPTPLKTGPQLASFIEGKIGWLSIPEEYGIDGTQKDGWHMFNGFEGLGQPRPSYSFALERCQMLYSK